MANRIQNDKGEWVIACGADGSQARVECEWPALIERINAIHDQYAQDGLTLEVLQHIRHEAVAEIRKAGIRSTLEIGSVLAVSKYQDAYEQWHRRSRDAAGAA